MASTAIPSPPRAPPIKYHTPLGTRWQKEKANAETGAFDYPEDAQFVGPWVIGECVGKGASGHVKIAKHRRTGQLAAVKILPVEPFANSRASLAVQAKTEKQRLGIDREITMMKLMNHPNIMRIYDVYEGENELYLILEYVEGGELFDFLVNRGKLPPLEALAYFRQIIYGLNYAHAFSIIHRDLKPENILIHSLNPPLIKIADWGMAAFAPPSLQLETSCGSPHYASPEIVNGHKYTGTATDIWSCGVILYALLTGRLPFDDKNVRVLLGKVKLGRYQMPTWVDPLAKDLLHRMLVLDVSKRITMAEILVHPWLQCPTPGILYVPAPSVTELARPLPSALHIDRDLFESLCVIWGRYADQEIIKADLLSPPGQGTLAKAFYFLLHKHRERTMEENGILMDMDEGAANAGKIVTKQYSAPRSARKTRHFAFQDVTRERVPSMPPQSQVRSVLRVNANQPGSNFGAPLSPPVERPSSRSIPSPVGPRPQRTRPPVAASHRYSYAAPSSVPAVDERRSNSLPYDDPDMQHRPQSAFVSSRRALPPMVRGPAMSAPGTTPIPQGQRSYVHSPVSSVIHAPVPVTAGASPMLPMISAPRAPNAELQRTLDEYASMVNTQAASWNARQVQDQVPQVVHDEDVTMHDVEGSPLPIQVHVQVQQTEQVQVREREPERMHRRRDSSAQAYLRAQMQQAEARQSRGDGDKENYNAHAAARRESLHASEHYQGGGLGFGHSVPMAKEMGNLVLISEQAFGKEHSKKDARKTRPPPPEPAATPNLGAPAKRSTFSLIGSPRADSPVGSPVAAEVRGWFTNLFHWRVQSYVLYAADGPGPARAEVVRLLARQGVAVALEELPAGCVLRCCAEDGPRQVRFRLEISAAAPSPLSPMSPRASLRVERLPPGHETVIAMALEKGSVSTFKTVYHRLRGEWGLDPLQSPRAVSGVGATPNPSEQRFALV